MLWVTLLSQHRSPIQFHFRSGLENFSRIDGVICCNDSNIWDFSFFPSELGIKYGNTELNL